MLEWENFAKWERRFWPLHAWIPSGELNTNIFQKEPRVIVFHNKLPTSPPTVPLQSWHLILALNTRGAQAYCTTARPIANQFPGHRCMDDLTTVHSFDWKLRCIDVFGLTCWHVTHWCLNNQAMADALCKQYTCKRSRVELYYGHLMRKISILRSWERN